VFTQRFDDRFVAGHGVACEVKQHRIGLQDCQSLRIDQVARCLEQRHMERYEVRVLNQLIDAVRLAHTRRQPPRGVDGDLGIEPGHLHTEVDRSFGENAPNCTEADDPESAAT
jgi:hypothetical protein